MRRLTLTVTALIFLSGCQPDVPSGGLSDDALRVRSEQIKMRLEQRANIKPKVVKISGNQSNRKLVVNIENNNQFDIVDPILACSSVGRSGSIIETIERKAYLTIPAKGQSKTAPISFGRFDEQGSQIFCEIAIWGRS
jgi:hypothetical protein